MIRVTLSLALVVTAALRTTIPATAQSVAEFYTGKQISLIVGASPGGGYDTQIVIADDQISAALPSKADIASRP